MELTTRGGSTALYLAAYIGDDKTVRSAAATRERRRCRGGNLMVWRGRDDVGDGAGVDYNGNVLGAAKSSSPTSRRKNHIAGRRDSLPLLVAHGQFPQLAIFHYEAYGIDLACKTLTVTPVLSNKFFSQSLLIPSQFPLEDLGPNAFSFPHFACSNISPVALVAAHSDGPFSSTRTIRAIELNSIVTLVQVAAARVSRDTIPMYCAIHSLGLAPFLPYNTLVQFTLSESQYLLMRESQARPHRESLEWRGCRNGKALCDHARTGYYSSSIKLIACNVAHKRVANLTHIAHLCTRYVIEFHLSLNGQTFAHCSRSSGVFDSASGNLSLAFSIFSDVMLYSSGETTPSHPVYAPTSLITRAFRFMSFTHLANSPFCFESLLSRREDKFSILPVLRAAIISSEYRLQHHQR
ncbi:uncharacterized protein BDR25DRAFT_363951 [Lindgomyces ingoldianus]|uniref:Uncharacterized protein n=1 Tax=Lindgomyces ingoldianus TaxID=673940 RepID=A0ACB6Q6Q1_9PLEO|nr:uncharacterized protein BDR25DRAFT_363951 [Lindgomyces ingoldianus]KAF2462536.1 hypothetical protein BDR25DRAFT_363951 [Lindgomyces ingoldianus]